MKASSLFAVTVAALLGLGAVAGAKYAGLFDRAEPAPEVKPPMPRVLVAGQNLFEDITITSSQVRLRELYPEEMGHYQKNKDKYMPALTAAAHMRTAARNIEADTPLLREHFLDQSLPEDITANMPPGMRAVNVQLPKERCSGGLIRVGEYVDIYLTSQIAGAPDSPPMTQTANLARGAKVIVKRNNPWHVMVPTNDDQPISFTLMTNSYRAALIEFAKTAGTLTMMPVPVPPEERVRQGSQARRLFSDVNSAEYRDEDQRVEQIQRGELVIGSHDLERIFRLAPIPVVVAAPPPPKADTILHYNGLSASRVTVLPIDPQKAPVTKPVGGDDGKVTPVASGLDRPALGYRFYPPEMALPASVAKSDCPSCDAARAAAARR